MLRTTCARCPTCGVDISIGDALTGRGVQAIGMLVEPDDEAVRHFYFNHTVPGCGTTFTVPVDTFAPLIGEAFPPTSQYGTAECEGHCTRIEDMAECGRPCENAPYRRFLLRLARRGQSRGAAATAALSPAAAAVRPPAPRPLRRATDPPA